MHGQVIQDTIEGNLSLEEIKTLKVGETIQSIKLTANSTEKSIPVQTYRILSRNDLQDKDGIPYIELRLNKISG